MIETKNLSVSIGNKPIIENINFVARPGEVTAIVGPNGSGKTTLLRALSGDITYTGSAYLDGEDFAGIKPWRMLRAGLCCRKPALCRFLLLSARSSISV